MVQVSVSLTGAKKKLSHENVRRGRYAAANQMLADMNQFVPMREGILRGTGHTTANADALIWNTPYAARLFYIYMYNYTTPGTGPRWDMRAKGMFMSDWINAFLKGADW
ncbi:minor capsid protein [Halalkalibacterium halodurans]|uniref:minor capsid protein n=1 Tax=Halalkalibacterium halodurans TaxID=86665 RepID=UPI0010FE9C2C|nr:minor capsid protein [Halalkalibacterium halodurans]